MSIFRKLDYDELDRYATLAKAELRQMKDAGVTAAQLKPEREVLSEFSLAKRWSLEAYLLRESTAIIVGFNKRADPVFGSLILEDAEMLGVDSLGESAVQVQFHLKTRPQQQWAVKRELLRRIKRRFDQEGIAIPYPQRTVYHRQAGDGPRPGDTSLAA